MQNTNDWQTTLAGTALAVAAIRNEHEPSEILESMARVWAFARCAKMKIEGHLLTNTLRENSLAQRWTRLLRKLFIQPSRW